MYNDKLIQYIGDKQSDILQALSDFIRIPSVSTDYSHVTEALSFILALGEKLGFQSHAYLGNKVGVIEIGSGEETLGILSHVDVVSPGDLSNWKTPPFEATIKDGRIYGRGAIDDKGAIIASLYAMKAVCDLGLPLHKKIQLILGTQEEVDWSDMREYVKKYSLPDYGFTPDGEFPLCNIEKGSLDITMTFPLKSEDPLEEGTYLVSVNAGTASNIVPGSCTAELATISNGTVMPTTIRTIKATGKPVHSCQPEKGDNAIFNMSHQLSGMQLKANNLLQLIKMLTEKFQDLYGKSLGLYSESEYYNGEFVHRNVFTPTLFKVCDGSATILINIRYAYGCDSAQLLDAFTSLAETYGGHIAKVTDLPAVYVSKDRPFVQAFAKAYDEVSDRKHEFVLAYGGSYAKAMPNIVSWGPIFPDEEDTCHEDNEYISIKSLMDNANIFASAIAKVALSEKSFK